MTEELYINGECVDLKPGARLTLNFKSNILGDISKITSSNSQTVHLPKTTRNRRILGNPTAVAYDSTTRYKRFRARYIKNGIEVIQAAYAVLLDSSADYEMAIFWGVMANFQTWVDKGAQLSDLDGTENLPWSSVNYVDTVPTMWSKGYGYAAYNCGVSNTSRINIHPSATAWWISNRIAAQAGFTIEIAIKYKQALQSLAIPCLSRNPSPESWDAEKSQISIGCKTIKEYIWTPPTGHRIGYEVGVFQKRSVAQRRDVYVGENVGYTYKTPEGGGQYSRTVKMAEFSTLTLDAMDIYIDARKVNINQYTRISMCVRKEGKQFSATDRKVFKSWTLSQQLEIRDTIDCSNFDYYYFILENVVQEDATYQIDINITPHAEDMMFPSVFRICPNLPEITQIDFIKAICAILGIFVTPDPSNDNNMKFASLDILTTNKVQALDWSNKLIRGNNDEPKTVKFRIADYCQNNIFKYKEDDTVKTPGDGNLTISNEALEHEKTVITLPFTPSDGNKIPHYQLSDSETEVKAVSIKDRIMNIVDNGGRAALTFDGLDFGTLLPKYYDTMSDMLNSAIMICERFTLSEYDLRQLDYTIPFYLRQYGKYYGIVSIQTSSDDVCEVEAVQLPATPFRMVEVTLFTEGYSVPDMSNHLSGNGKYIKGAFVTVSATDTLAYKFQHWRICGTGDILSSERSYTFIAVDDIKLSAFYKYEY